MPKISKEWKMLGIAGEQMLDEWLKQLGFETHPHEWDLETYETYSGRGVDNWIEHPQKGIIGFEIKNFKFNGKTTKKSYETAKNEILNEFRGFLNRYRCELLLSHIYAIPRKLQSELTLRGIRITIYDIQVLPNDPITKQTAWYKLNHTLLYKDLTQFDLEYETRKLEEMRKKLKNP